MARRRDRDDIPQVSLSHRAGPSLDEQLVELVNVPPATPVSESDIQPPPQLIPFVYQPAPRPSRSRSTSPTKYVVPLPGHGAIGDQSGQPGAPAQGPVYAPIPPGPAVVQLPYDTLMAILRENRLAQPATVDQQHELTRYMSGLNDWLTKDVQDRQAELRGVTARVDQLQEGLGRLGVSAGLGVSIPRPHAQTQTGQPAGAGGFIILPVFPTPGGPVPPVVPYPAAFFPPGAQLPDRSPSAYSGMPVPDPSQHAGPTRPVLPAGTLYGEYPSQYVHHTEEPRERLIPSTSSSGSRSLPTFVPPLPGHDSRGLTPTQKSYHPPHSPRALPVPPGDVPNDILVDPSISGPLPHQTIINIPQIGVPPPGHIAESGIPVQSSPSGILPGATVQPSLQGAPNRPIVIHLPMPGPVPESVHVPSRASSRVSTSDATLPSEPGVRDRRPSLSMEGAPESSRHHSSYASEVGNERRSPQRMLPADLDDEQRNSSKAHPGSGSGHGLASLEGEVLSFAPTIVAPECPEAEKIRANAAEHRAIDYFHGLRIAVKNRNRAEQESARLREELRLYKLQLENAQKEIFRAQDTVNQVASQRNEAEAEAARARTKARKVQEENLVILAREEGRKLGYQEGLSMGRWIGYNKEPHDGDENMPQPGKATSNEERDNPRSHVQLRSDASTGQRPTCSASAPPVNTSETPTHPPPLLAPPTIIRISHSPSHEHHTPPPSPRDLYSPELEAIHQIPIRPSPTIFNQPVGVPTDGWIPRADSRTSYIRLPPPHELRRSISPSPSSIATEVKHGRPTRQSEPTPVGSQPSRESTSRNEYRDQDRHYSSRAEAASIAKRRHADEDRSPSRLSTSSAVLHSHQPPGFHSPPPPGFGEQARQIVTPSPYRDTNDPKPRYRIIPTESTAGTEYMPPDDPAPRHAGTRSVIPMPLEDANRPQPRHGRVVPTESAAGTEYVPPDEGIRSVTAGFMPLEDVSDPQPRRVVPTESAAATEYMPPDGSVPQPTGTWPVIVTPTPLWDVNDLQPSRVVTTESAPVRSHPPPTSRPARTRFPFEYLRRLFRQSRRGSRSSSTLNIAIEPPSVSETSQTTMSPSENRSLLQDDVHQYRRRPSHSHWGSRSRSRPPSHRSSSYDAAQHSETHRTPWPANFVPGRGTISSSSSPSSSPPSSKLGPSLKRDYRHTHSHPVSMRASYYHNRGGDGDGDGDREKRRDSGKDYEREHDRDRDRDGEDPEDRDPDEELPRSPPSPLQRPVLLFDIDEEQ